ncbi:MAG: signal peptidase II [Blautia sp.]|jgi:signal peptidase II
MKIPKKERPLPYVLGGIIWLTILIWFDQWTKLLAVQHLKGQSSIPLIKGVLELQYLENRGAAFGMLQNFQWVFVVLCAVFLIGAIVFYWLLPSTKRMLPLHILCILAMAGGIGNAIDRILHNYVIDFVYFSLIDFPIFNVADCYVVICAVCLLIFFFFYYKEEDFAFLSRKSDEKKAKS